MKRILLVNPWIADTAAYNFWIRPIGLYEIATWLYQRGALPLLLDTLAGISAPGKIPQKTVPAPHVFFSEKNKKFRRYGMSEKEFIQRLQNVIPVDAVMVSSSMSYWYPGVKWAVTIIKNYCPDIPIILGGVYATLWHEHAKNFSGADFIFKGTLKSNSNKIATLLDLPERTNREHKTWYELGLHDNEDYCAIRSARGCPFDCSYCASKQLSDGFEPLNINALFNELKALYSLGVKQAAFYDDALLINFKGHLKPLLEKTVNSGLKFQFHTPNGMHASLIDKETALTLFKSNFKTVRLSLETVNPVRQKKTGGKVICSETSKAVKNLLKAGFKPESIGVYLLAGLPGQPLSEVKKGIDFVKSLGVRPFLAEFSPIPGTREWKRLEQEGVVDMGMDPILTNNSIFQYYYQYKIRGNYGEKEFRKLQTYCREANTFWAQHN